MRTVFPIASSTNSGGESSDNEDDDVKVKLLLTLDQLHTYCYPVPNVKTKAEGFVMTKDRYAPVTADSPIYAIDCEMVMTSTGEHELAAVCFMDSDFKVRNTYSIYFMRTDHRENISIF